ncbi:MAG: hypothetical protein ACW972_02095 [Promethearchaeota archaeon]|jgi:hypothetical protein
MGNKDYESHAFDKLRTPIIKSLNDRMAIGKSNHNITGYEQVKDNFLLQPKKMEEAGIIYPYLLTDSLIKKNPKGLATAYYMRNYYGSFEFLDISGAYPVRIDYIALAKYFTKIRRNRHLKELIDLEKKIMSPKGVKRDYTYNDKERLMEYKYNFMSGTENQRRVWKTSQFNKYYDRGDGLGYLYLTKDDVVKLLEMGGEPEEIDWLETKKEMRCQLCDEERDIPCECSDGRITCDACEEGQIECGECGGGGYGTCGACAGDGIEECYYCGGRGKGGEYGNCDDCEGSGEIEEPCPRCIGGKVKCDECDNTGKNDEGKECVECDGVGEIDCETCDGDNEVTKTCENCDGSGEVGCDYCGGEGEYQCDNCNGEGQVEGGCAYCDYGRIECDECGGEDEIECPVCEGNEYVQCVFSEGENLNNVDIIKKQEPFSANFDWKLKQGRIKLKNDVFWIVENIFVSNWQEADISRLKELLGQWSDENVYAIGNDAFEKISNFHIVYTLATPKGLIKEALKIYFVWDEEREVFSVVRIDGGKGKVMSHRKGASYEDEKLIYYYLSGIRLLNWNHFDLDNLKY